MPNIFKYFSRESAESYVFRDVTSISLEGDEPEADAEGALEAEDEGAVGSKERGPETPIDFANIQAEAILEDARREAEEILEKAREKARLEAEEMFQSAKDSGRLEGYAEGAAQAAEEGVRCREELAARMEADVQKFLDRAGAALDRQLDDNLGELRDLAIAIAEKVVCVSLRSSTDIIGRMVQTALDKRKHREWVHIYIAECDAKRMGQMPASFTSAISALSDRVRIIPMAEDESGTCIIEMPDEIIDASASTQISNIRGILTNMAHTEAEPTQFSL